LWARSWGPWLRHATDADLLLTVCEQADERNALRLRVMRDNDWHDRAALRALDAQVTGGLQAIAALRSAHEARSVSPAPADAPPAPGRNVARVEALLASLRSAGPLDTRDEALGQLALTLAAQLDLPGATGTAALSRELRAALSDLTEDRNGRDDDHAWTTQLSAPVRHPAQP
jgi:hypothetical protein